MIYPQHFSINPPFFHNMQNNYSIKRLNSIENQNKAGFISECDIKQENYKNEFKGQNFSILTDFKIDDLIILGLLFIIFTQDNQPDYFLCIILLLLFLDK